MRGHRYRVFLLLTIVGLSSCASYKGFPDRVIDPCTELNDLRSYYTKAKMDEYKNSGSNEDLRRQIRNEIINGRIAAIDLQFALFQRKLLEEGINLNVGSDAIVLGLGAAGALVSGGTSKVLSATSAAVTGMRESIDKNEFYKQTMPALFAQMIAQRKRVLVTIRTGLTKNSTDYPLEQGFVDLGDYEYAGSIPGSIASVVVDAGGTSAMANEKLDKILPFNMDKWAQSLEQYLGPPNPNDNTYDPEKVKKVKECWKTVGVPANTLFIDFRLDPDLSEQRKAVMDCLNSSGH